MAARKEWVGDLALALPRESLPAHQTRQRVGLPALISDEHVEQTAAANGVVMRGVEKRFGATAVLRGLDLTVAPGEVLSIFGPNGAGKTTLLRILPTLTRPDAGTIRVGGNDAAQFPEFVRSITGVVLHSPLLYGELTVRENLRFAARMFRIDDCEGRHNVNYWRDGEYLGLGPFSRRHRGDRDACPGARSGRFRPHRHHRARPCGLFG